MKKAFIVCSLVILVVVSFWVWTFNAPQAATLKEGDIVFQTSTSQQAPITIAATHSPWSHCGIIIEKADGLYVLEAVSTVRLNPYDQWVKRGKGGIVKVKRYTEEPIKIKYKKYLGRPYDTAFKFGDDKWYCSELVYDIYKQQFRVELCEPRPVSDYSISGASEQLKKRGINKNQLVVAPCDVHNSKRLK